MIFVLTVHSNHQLGGD